MDEQQWAAMQPVVMEALERSKGFTRPLRRFKRAVEYVEQDKRTESIIGTVLLAVAIEAIKLFILKMIERQQTGATTAVDPVEEFMQFRPKNA